MDTLYIDRLSAMILVLAVNHAIMMCMYIYTTSGGGYTCLYLEPKMIEAIEIAPSQFME